MCGWQSLHGDYDGSEKEVQGASDGCWCSIYSCEKSCENHLHRETSEPKLGFKTRSRNQTLATTKETVVSALWQACFKIYSMMFFRNNKDMKTEDLRLSDYDQIWTKFCFLDETGTLSDQKDQYFTVGILKMSQPYYLQSKLYYERSKARYYDEIKFNKLSKNNVSEELRTGADGYTDVLKIEDDIWGRELKYRSEK